MELTTSVPAAPYLATVSLPGVGKADGTLTMRGIEFAEEFAGLLLAFQCVMIGNL